MAYSGAGSGTSGSPYLITTVDQLNEIRDFPSAYWKLANDIDASATINWNDGLGWIPIPSFYGELDGDGHTISGLYINQPDNDFDASFIGTIEDDAVIKNLNIVDSYAQGTHTGGLAANSDGTIRNVHISGTTVIYYYDTIQGGLVGHCTGIVEDCSVNAIIGPKEGTLPSLRPYVGGVLGFAWSESGKYMNRCAFYGEVYGYTFVGGLVGLVGTIQSAYPGDYSINNSYNLGYVFGNSDAEPLMGVGGLVGGFTGYGVVYNCYSAGVVEDANRAGGLIGVTDVPGQIYDSYWDTQASEQATSSAGIGKTTAQMKDLSTFYSWDIASIYNYSNQDWFIDPGVDYPRLAWEFEGEVENKIHVSASLTNSQQTLSAQGIVLPIDTIQVVLQNGLQLIESVVSNVVSVTSTLQNTSQSVQGITKALVKAVTALNNVSQSLQAQTSSDIKAEVGIINTSQTVASVVAISVKIESTIANAPQGINIVSEVRVSSQISLVNWQQTIEVITTSLSGVRVTLENANQALSSHLKVSVIVEAGLTNSPQELAGNAVNLVQVAAQVNNTPQSILAQISSLSGAVVYLTNTPQEIAASIVSLLNVTASLSNDPQLIGTLVQVITKAIVSLENTPQTLSVQTVPKSSVVVSLENYPQLIAALGTSTIRIEGQVVNANQLVQAQAYIPVHAQVGLTNAMQIFYASALVIQLNLFFGLKQVVALYYGETRINNAKMKKS